MRYIALIAVILLATAGSALGAFAIFQTAGAVVQQPGQQVITSAQSGQSAGQSVVTTAQTGQSAGLNVQTSQQ